MKGFLIGLTILLGIFAIGATLDAQGRSSGGGIDVDIKRDYGAIGNGVTDDTTAFHNFNVWARRQKRSIQLTIPPGNYNINTFSGQRFTTGIKNLVVDAYGASVNSIFLGNTFQQNKTTSALVNAVTKGTETVTLLAPSQNTIFSVGGWVCITAYDIQSAGSSAYGFPPNPQFFEFRKVNSTNPTTGNIVLDRPLLNSYSATYPQYNTGSAFEIAPGGPARLYAMHPDWDQTLVIRGLDVTLSANDIFGGPRSLTFIDCKFNRSPDPTVATDVTFNRCEVTGGLTEVDKVVRLLRFDNFKQRIIKQQSSSIEKCVIRDSQILALQGTAKNQVIENSDIGELDLGPLAYGAVDSIIIKDSRIGSIANSSGGFSTFAAASEYANGTFTFQKYDTVYGSGFIYRRIVPGHIYMLGEALPFLVTNVREDGTHVFVDTTLPATINVPQVGYASGDPTGYAPGTMGWGVRHVLQNVSVTNSYGCQDIENLSNSPLAKTRFGEYALYHLTGESFVSSNAPVSQMWGNIVSLRVNVKRAYSGTRSTLILSPLGQFGVNTLSDANGSTVTQYNPGINLKIAGERIIKPGATTGTQTGDINITTSGAWLYRNIAPFLSTNGNGTAADISGENLAAVGPVVDVELITNQNSY